MIEFSKTGPLNTTPPESSPLYIGIGGAGLAVVDQIQLRHPWAQGSVYAIDSDLGSIRGSVATDKFLLGHDACRGIGGWSDKETIMSATLRQQKEILDMLEVREWAVVVCGLGGATGSGAVYDVVKMLNGRNCRVLVVAILPFAFESKTRRQNAVDSLQRLESVAELVLACDNDRLTETIRPELDFREALHEMNIQLAHGLVDLSRILLSDSAIQLDLDDCRHLLGAEGSGRLVEANCWMSHATDSGQDAESMIEMALDGIQFRDGKVWDRADGLVATIIGGRDLSMDFSQEMIRILTGMIPDGMEVSTGALCDPELQNEVRLTLIATRAERGSVAGDDAQAGEMMSEMEIPPSDTADEPIEVIDEAPEPEEEPVRELAEVVENRIQPLFEHQAGTPQRYFSEQEELPLDRKEDRGWFEKTTPTTFNGQDLDRPTYQRLGMKIRL